MTAIEATRLQNGQCIKCGDFSDWFRLCKACTDHIMVHDRPEKRLEVPEFKDVDDANLSDEELHIQLTTNYPQLAHFYQWLGEFIDN